MKKLFQISFVSFILISNYMVGQQKLSLNDAVKITLENNLDIKIVENQDEIFKNNASFLNSGYLPTISSNAGINKSEQNIEIETPNNLSRLSTLLEYLFLIASGLFENLNESNFSIILVSKSSQEISFPK